MDREKAAQEPSCPRCLLGSQLARRPVLTEARIETPDPRQKAEASIRPCRCKMTARAFCTASTSSGVHSTSIATYFLARAPLEVRLPQTITRPFCSRIVSPENMKRAGITAQFRLGSFGLSLVQPFCNTGRIRPARKDGVGVNDR